MEFIILGLIIGILLSPIFIFSMVMTTKKAKKKAYKILDGQEINKKEIRKVIKKLSAYQNRHDSEAKELVRKLIDISTG